MPLVSDRSEIERALNAAGGKMNRAARLLGISRRQLQNRMRRAGMGPRKAGRPSRTLRFRRKRGWGLGAAAVAAAGLAALALRKGKST